MAGIVNPKGKKKSEPRLRPSIKKDTIHPSDYLAYDLRFSCEDCSHYDPAINKCSIGYDPSHHLKATQKHQFQLSGNMALCRFLEID